MALWADAILAFAYAYDKLIASQVRLGMDLIRPNISCTDGRGWPLGIELHTKFNQVFEIIIEKKELKKNLFFFFNRFLLMELPVKFNLHQMENEQDLYLMLFIYHKLAFQK